MLGTFLNQGLQLPDVSSWVTCHLTPLYHEVGYQMVEVGLGLVRLMKPYSLHSFGNSFSLCFEGDGLYELCNLRSLWGSYGTHTTFLCPSLTSWCCYFIASSTSCLHSHHLQFSLGVAVWGSLSLALDSQIQGLASFV